MPGVSCVVTLPVFQGGKSLDWAADKVLDHIALRTRLLPHTRSLKTRFDARVVTITLDHAGYGITSHESGDWILYLECQRQEALSP